jgi:ankyrin repeat protein
LFHIDTITLQSAPLDWTVSPRFAVGYRLPSGFGEFSLGYRFLATQGADSSDQPLGPASLSSRLDINAVDNFHISALNYAVLNENWNVAVLLIENLPDNPQTDSIVGATISFAVVEDNLEMVRQLLKKLKNIDWTDPDGYTTLLASLLADLVFLPALIMLIRKVWPHRVVG